MSNVRVSMFSVSRNVLYVLLLLVLVFRLPLRTPAESFFYIIEAMVLFSLLCYLGALALRRVLFRRRLVPVEAWSLVFLILPVVSAFTANDQFGQPLIFGLLSQRPFLWAVSTLVFSRLLLAHRLKLGDLEQALILLSLISMVLWTGLALFVDSDTWQLLGGKVMHSGFRGTRIKVETHATVFGTLYFTILAARRPRLAYALLAACFWAYILFISKGRGLLLAVLAGVAAYFWGTGLIRKGDLIKYGLYALVAVIGLVVIPALLIPSFAEYLSRGFLAALQVVFTGEYTGERSADIRLRGFLMYLPYIQDRFVFGNGILSTQWEGGLTAIMGKASPGDLGLIGTAYYFGLLGFAVLAYVIWKIVPYWRSIHPQKDDVFAVACKYFLVTAAARIVITGPIYVNRTGVITFFIMYIWYYSLNRRRLA